MHNLAIALHSKGYDVSGSDDEIFEPSRSRLMKYGLLPGSTGWDPGKITRDINLIILGMHARNDNPELIKARELGLKIMSFPEYIYEETRTKKRIVVAGSHGKTTITAMIMHVLRHMNITFDYMAGSSIDGFETMVGLSENSSLAVLEGDEYHTSPVDPRPKFHLYIPDIAILNGIAWDHANVFPTFKAYTDQFRIFVEKINEGGSLIYYSGDNEVKKIVVSSRPDIKKIPYDIHGHFQNNKGFFATAPDRIVPLNIFGEHNMQNLSAAREACMMVGIGDDEFYDAIQSFQGTSKRLQKLAENKNGAVYIDFAHSPSKVKATLEAVASRYPGKNIIACFELHTYSSLNIDFLPQYRGTMSKASRSFVYFNPHAVRIKKLEPLSAEAIKNAFGDENLSVFNNSADLFSFIKGEHFRDPVFLFMSSGDFDGCDINLITNELLQ